RHPIVSLSCINPSFLTKIKRVLQHFRITIGKLCPEPLPLQPERKALLKNKEFLSFKTTF
ncbi:hypothetical protein, partial [Streptococcus pneumoniae]|uniref:hypothetical protein n=1 Tax=Streptococcus pneumoniae TaxID=1313 RepID=UPI001C2BBEFB